MERDGPSQVFGLGDDSAGAGEDRVKGWATGAARVGAKMGWITAESVPAKREGGWTGRKLEEKGKIFSSKTTSRE